jgi:hypothetical protein
MNKNDLQLLRTAALELQESGTDLVRVAGIVQQIKNWWKARFSKEFAERQGKVEEAYIGMKGPLSDLINQLTEIDKAFKSQDPDTIAKLVGIVPETIAQVTRDMNNLSKEMRAADAVIPVTYVDESGREISGDNVSWMTSGYQKDRNLIEKMWEQLPEQFQKIPIGRKINQPITDFEWFANYNPSQIYISSTVYEDAKLEMRKALERGQLEPDVVDLVITYGFDDFIENLKVAILQNSILLQARFPDISAKITHRRVNEMLVDVQPGFVALPVMSYDFYIHVGLVRLHDLGASVTPTPQLSVAMVRHIRLSTDTIRALKEKWRESKGFGKKPQEPVGQETESEIINQQVQNINQNKEENKDEKVLTASGPITKIVKRALLKECLPIVPAVVKVDGLEFHHKARFAKILSSALRQEIDAECSVRNNGNNVEVQVFASGSKMNVVPAIYGISTYIADEYLKTTKAGIEIDVQYGHSAFEVMGSDVLDQSFRKVAFDNWRMS